MYSILTHVLGRQVLSLAAGQFFIEYYEQPYEPDPRGYVKSAHAGRTIPNRTAI